MAQGAESGNNLTMKCDVCGLYVQQVSNLAAFNRLMQHHCVDGTGILPPEWNVHPSHRMVNMGVQWSCTRCGRLQRPHLEAASSALQNRVTGGLRRASSLSKLRAQVPEFSTATIRSMFLKSRFPLVLRKSSLSPNQRSHTKGVDVWAICCGSGVTD